MNSPINVMVDSKTKEEATAILKDLGLSMSAAINLFLKQVIKRDGLPFEVRNRKPSKELIEALKEANDIANGIIEVPSYDNRKDLKEALLKDD